MRDRENFRVNLAEDKNVERIIRGLFGKMSFFSLFLYFHPFLLKIGALPPYEIYVSGMGKIWAVLYETFEEITLKSKILSRIFRKNEK